MKRSETIGALAAALSKAQAMISGATKDHTAKVKSDKGNYEYKYATLAGTWDACRVALTANELTVLQPAETLADGSVRVTTLLAHSSGEWVESEITMRGGSTPQSIGSAVTYCRRYALGAMVGVATEEDDDGQAAATPPQGGGYTPPPVQTQRTAPPPAARAPASGPRELTPEESRPFDGPQAAPRSREPGEDDEPPTVADLTARIAADTKNGDLADLESPQFKKALEYVCQGNKEHPLVAVWKGAVKAVRAAKGQSKPVAA